MDYAKVSDSLKRLRAETDTIDEEYLVYSVAGCEHEYGDDVKKPLIKVMKKFDNQEELTESDMSFLKSLYFMHYLDEFYHVEEEVLNKGNFALVASEEDEFEAVLKKLLGIEDDE